MPLRSRVDYGLLFPNPFMEELPTIHPQPLSRWLRPNQRSGQSSSKIRVALSPSSIDKRNGQARIVLPSRENGVPPTIDELAMPKGWIFCGVVTLDC